VLTCANDVKEMVMQDPLFFFVGPHIFISVLPEAHNEFLPIVTVHLEVEKACAGVVRVLGILWHILIPNHKANHAMSEKEQHYGIIGIACVRG
jgi:hypothetical protein